MAHNTKGSQRERELINYIYQTPEWISMRAPASGGGTDRELPDALVGNDGESYAIEAKSSGGDPIYIDEEEVEALYVFATAFGAKARIGVRFDLEHGDPAHGSDTQLTGWYFLDPEDLYRTPSGNYRVKKEKALSDGTQFIDLFGVPQDEDDE